MAPGTLTLEITIPHSKASDAEAAHRATLKGLLMQAAHQIGDVRQTSGELTHNHGAGSEVHGRWSYTPPTPAT